MPVPPGWHPDPWGAAPLRWWNGASWTAHTSATARPGPVGAPRRSRLGPALVGSAASLVLLAGVAVAAAPLTAPPQVRGGEPCGSGDGTALCTEHVLSGDPWVWEPDADGRVVVHYRVNTTVPAGQRVDGDDLVEATRRAAETWERVAPSLDLVDDGTTDKQAGEADGVNVVGFGAEEDEAVAVALLLGEGDDHEVDVVLEHDDEVWVHSPCDAPRCPGYASDRDQALQELAETAHLAELQSVLTHELGHLLGLDHTGGDALTMSSDWYDEALSPQTLGLGDVLGVRRLYPCDCPAPVVADD